MNLLYITAMSKDYSEGIWKKIEANLYAYKRLGFSVDIIYKTSIGFVLEKNFGENIKEVFKIDVTTHLLFRKLASELDKEYDIIYMRKMNGITSLFLGFFLKKIRKSNPLCKFIYEIPTYPYWKEIKSIKHVISEFFLYISSLSFRKYIALITYMGDDVNNILGRPTLRISNGIDLKDNRLICQDKRICNDHIVFIGVAKLNFWHGYDRLIKSIHNYKGCKKIVFNIVGTGPELEPLIKLSKDYNLFEKQIFFLNDLFGESLDYAYKSSHICVDSLGRHRTGHVNNNSLKSKEYVARGFPFIKSHQDYSFNNEFFIFDVSISEEDILLNDIIDWYYSLPQNYPMLIRKYAEDNLSWDIQCKNVIEYNEKLVSNK